MRPDRDYILAQFGTESHLFADGRYMSVIEQAEAFNAGSPFTLCQCPSLGKGDMNLTRDLRERLASGQWVPESGITKLAVMTPANGRWFTVELRLAVVEGGPSEVMFRLDRSYVQSDALESTVEFLELIAAKLEASWGFAHDAFDVAVQDATTPEQFRALTGTPPPSVPIDPLNNPGRTAQLGDLLLTCRWLTVFGPETVTLVGDKRISEAPCTVKALDDERRLLRLYEDPLAYSLPDNRSVQKEVREHLRLDQLLESGRWEAVERRPTGDHPPASEANGSDGTHDEGYPHDEDGDDGSAPPPVSLWAALYDAAIDAQTGEVEFYRAQARRAAGRVLEIGCGTGRITLPILRTGVPVVAVDPSTEVIEHVRDQLSGEAEALRRRATLINDDVRDIDISGAGPFAAIFVPYRGINRFTDPHELRELLETLRKNLQQGGVLALNTFFPQPAFMSTESSVVAVVEYDENDTDDEEPTRFIVYDTVDSDPVAQRLNIMRRFDELDATGRVVEQRYLLLERRYYFPDELSYLLELTGFSATVYGGFAGQPLTSPDEEVVVVARRL